MLYLLVNSTLISASQLTQCNHELNPSPTENFLPQTKSKNRSQTRYQLSLFCHNQLQRITKFRYLANHRHHRFQYTKSKSEFANNLTCFCATGFGPHPLSFIGTLHSICIAWSKLIVFMAVIHSNFVAVVTFHRLYDKFFFFFQRWAQVLS